MPTSDDSTHCTAPPLKTYSLALTARRGCYGDHYPHTYAHSAPPTTPASRRRRRSTTKSVTPTFQVDDLHCIVDARARDGPHLDSELTPLPFPLADVDRPTATPVRSRGCSRRRRRRRRDVERVENGPDRGLSLLETEDCLAGYSELLGGWRSRGCILIALSRCFSFLPRSLFFRVCFLWVRDEANASCISNRRARNYGWIDRVSYSVSWIELGFTYRSRRVLSSTLLFI